MRGTVLIVGSKERPIELLAARLEKEHYSVVFVASASQAQREIKRQHPVAVLCTSACGRPLIARLAAFTRRNPKTRQSPVIVVGDHEISADIMRIQDVGEAFRLHRIPLVEAVRRLELAINLMHLTYTG